MTLFRYGSSWLSIKKSVNELKNKEIAYKAEVDKIFEKLQKSRLQAAAIVADKHLQPLVDLDNQIDSLSERLSILYKDAETCKTTCDDINKEVRDSEKIKYQAQKDRRKLALENADDVRAYDKLKAVSDAYDQNYNEAKKSFSEIKADIKQAHDEFGSMYSTFGKLEGARVAMNYTSPWDDNMASLRDNNPGFQFEKITTQNTKLFTNLIGVKDIPGDQAVLAYEMPGVLKDGVLDLQSGFPGSLSANIVLSVVGVCPMLHPEDFELTESSTPEKMSYGLTFIYDFPAAMKVVGTAKYNMYKMYQKIMSSGSSGGFFSSRSWSNVEEHTFFKDSFTVDWVTQDAANSITEDERLNMEHEMRAHIMERIAALALPTAPNRDQMMAPGTPPPHGAVVVAGSLMQACPGNMYCMAGSLILSSLDAIFGSSSSTANYLQTQNFDLTETWSNSKVVLKPWITSFVPTKQ